MPQLFEDLNNDRPAKQQNNEEIKINSLKEFGQLDIPVYKSDIHCLTISGQIEGHMVLPVQNKTTKYEHVIPQLVAI
ncbi:MAG: hypothetical protein LBK69_06250, partial [Syntrophomonadaceae bacterium]|nr:hypothetical protein [Syntrophomonadaceae bacterium]